MNVVLLRADTSERSKDDTMLKSEVADLDGSEQLGSGHFVKIVSSGARIAAGRE